MKIRLLAIAFILACNILHAGQTNSLELRDIRKTMNQMLSQHVEKKTITPEVIKVSFKSYIDVFDPNRIYLLESEARPYLHMSDYEAKNILDQYNADNFQEYVKLDKMIQHAIERARTDRKDLKQYKEEQLFNPGFKLEQTWRDAGPQSPFAKNPEELKNRIEYDIMEYILNAKKHFGVESVMHNKKHVLAMYDNEMLHHENDYFLTAGKNSKAPTAAQQESFVALHILKALASTLDAHTKIFNQEEAYDMKVRLEKGFQGIGLELQEHPEGIVITALTKGGPAEKNGKIKVNDLLLTIDGHNVNDMAFENVLDMLHGENGASVALTLHHPANNRLKEPEETYSVKLTRAPIAVNIGRVETDYETYGNGIIARITLHSFYQGDSDITSEKDVQEAIQALKKQGNLRGLILDLRDNTGGFLMQAVKVAGLFITKGVIVISKYSNGSEHFFRDTDGKISYEGPLVILTSKETASAAEIVTQALQDYGVALVVGDEHTFGKGTIQSQNVTGTEGKSFFKITVGKYYTVSGKTPQNKGVIADIVVPSPVSNEQIGEEYLDETVASDTIPPVFDDPLADVEPSMKPWYMHYYAPNVQHRKYIWRDMLPTLKKKSDERMNNNKAYAEFLKRNRGTIPETNNDNSQTPTKDLDQDAMTDLQLNEALNILKDMIQLQTTVTNPKD